MSTLRPALDQVREARVVDDDRVEPLHVQRALPRGGHREQERRANVALEKRADHANRLAAVIVRDLEARVPRRNVLGDLLHHRAGRQEHADAALLPDHALQEPVVEERRSRRAE